MFESTKFKVFWPTLTVLTVKEPVMSTDPVIVWFPIKIFEPVVANEPVSIPPPGTP